MHPKRQDVTRGVVAVDEDRDGIHKCVECGHGED